MSVLTAGRLAENVMHFGRVLRAAGLPVGPDRVIQALHALTLTSLERREDVHAALNAVLIHRHEHQALFDQAFDLFWRDPRLRERMRHLLLPKAHGRTPPPAISRRLAQTWSADARRLAPAPRCLLELDARFSFSEQERLQAKDFEDMSADELAQVKRLLRCLDLPLKPVPTRRYAPARRGAQLDLRAMLRTSARDPAGIAFRWRVRRTRDPRLVVLCDISGSMSVYSRLFLHFLHALVNARPHVEVFLFGTRLTPITRQLRQRDPDQALAQAGRAAPDWAGGTRIGQCLRAFNRRWARRVLAHGAAVLLLTDGLDRDAGAGLASEMERLRKSCRRLIWLNPLLRYRGFEVKSAGVRAMRPHVDEFLPAHNLQSLEELANVLAGGASRRHSPA